MSVFKNNSDPTSKPIHEKSLSPNVEKGAVIEPSAFVGNNKIYVEAMDRPCSLHAITKVVSQAGLNLIYASANGEDNEVDFQCVLRHCPKSINRKRLEERIIKTLKTTNLPKCQQNVGDWTYDIHFEAETNKVGFLERVCELFYGQLKLNIVKAKVVCRNRTFVDGRLTVQIPKEQLQDGIEPIWNSFKSIQSRYLAKFSLQANELHPNNWVKLMNKPIVARIEDVELN